MPKLQNSPEKHLRNNQDIAFVIGGGPSLKGFDFESLRGLPCYAANKAAIFVPWGNLVSIDGDFYRNYPEIIESFSVRAYLAPPGGQNRLYSQANYFHRSRGRDIFERKESALPGLNSGFAALSLAVRHGFKRIALLGIDMQPGKGHFHDGYAHNGGRDGITRFWVEDFDAAGDQCAAHGIDAINFSLHSAVNGFRKEDVSRVHDKTVWQI